MIKEREKEIGLIDNGTCSGQRSELHLLVHWTLLYKTGVTQETNFRPLVLRLSLYSQSRLLSEAMSETKCKLGGTVCSTIQIT